MRLITTILFTLLRRWIADRRKPDLVIGSDENPYMRRWWVIPRNKLFNIYLHNVLRDDDDRALHDHPWLNISIVLAGGYWEWLPREGGREFLSHAQLSADGSQVGLWRDPGSIVFRRATAAHRLALAHFKPIGPMDHILYTATDPTWTLFITGPRLRTWGFRCPKGFVPWRDYTSPDGRTIGKGCGE
jgi:hypothetical protein